MIQDGVATAVGGVAVQVTTEINLHAQTVLGGAATAAKHMFSAGTLHWARSLAPQATTAPSGSRARLCVRTESRTAIYFARVYVISIILISLPSGLAAYIV